MTVLISTFFRVINISPETAALWRYPSNPEPRSSRKNTGVGAVRARQTSPMASAICYRCRRGVAVVFGHPRHDRGKICLWWPQIAPDGLVLALPDATGDSACVLILQ